MLLTELLDLTDEMFLFEMKERESVTWRPPDQRGLESSSGSSVTACW